MTAVAVRIATAAPLWQDDFSKIARRKKKADIMRKLERNKSPYIALKAKWRNEKITQKSRRKNGCFGWLSSFVSLSSDITLAFRKLLSLNFYSLRAFGSAKSFGFFSNELRMRQMNIPIVYQSISVEFLTFKAIWLKAFGIILAKSSSANRISPTK